MGAGGLVDGRVTFGMTLGVHHRHSFRHVGAFCRGNAATLEDGYMVVETDLDVGLCRHFCIL